MMKNFKKHMLIIPLAIIFLSNIALAQVQGNPAKGEVLYKSCISCHTVKGKGIAGMEEKALVEKMTAFQKGTFTTTKQIMMQKALKPMNEQQLIDLASYINKM